MKYPLIIHFHSKTYYAQHYTTQLPQEESDEVALRTYGKVTRWSNRTSVNIESICQYPHRLLWFEPYNALATRYSEIIGRTADQLVKESVPPIEVPTIFFKAADNMYEPPSTLNFDLPITATADEINKVCNAHLYAAFHTVVGAAMQAARYLANEWRYCVLHLDIYDKDFNFINAHETLPTSTNMSLREIERHVKTLTNLELCNNEQCEPRIVWFPASDRERETITQFTAACIENPSRVK